MKKIIIVIILLATLIGGYMYFLKLGTPDIAESASNIVYFNKEKKIKEVSKDSPQFKNITTIIDAQLEDTYSMVIVSNSKLTEYIMITLDNKITNKYSKEPFSELYVLVGNSGSAIMLGKDIGNEWLYLSTENMKEIEKNLK